MKRNTSGLKRTAGPGRPKGLKNKVTLEQRAFLLSIAEDTDYRANFRKRAIKGDASLDRLIHDHAIGKPTERHEHSGAVTVKHYGWLDQ